MLKSPARESAIAAIASVLLAAIAWFPVIRDLEATGFGDWQMVHHNWEAGLISLVRFHEWPLWDPFHCGGVPLLGNPESQLYAPWFWLSFLFGTVIAIKIMLIGHNAIALSGMYWLARRRYQLQAPSAAIAAIAWAWCGCFTWDDAGGHATFMPFAFTPWLSYFVHRRQHFTRELAWVTVLLVATLFEGGTYPLPYFVLWLGVELTLRATVERAWRSSASFALLSGALLAVCGAIRFVPVYMQLSAHPRTVPNDDALSIGEVWPMLTARWHAWVMPGHPFVWPEYGSYVGAPIVLLATIGLVLSLRRRSGRRHWLVCLILYGSLMLGNWSDYAPFSLLHHLPIYDSLRVPSRFAIFVTFFLALAAAGTVDVILRANQQRRFIAPLAWLSACALAIDLLSVSWPIAQLWREPPLNRAQPAAEFHLVRLDYYRFYASYPRLNLGTPFCYVGGMNWPVSPALWLGPQPQLRLSRAVGSVRSWRKTPQRFEAELELSAPVRVILNQNYAPGYVTNLGPAVADSGRLAVDVQAGKQRLEVRYQPSEFAPSAAISCSGLCLLGWLFSRRRRA